MTEPTTWNASRVVAGTSLDVRSPAPAKKARTTGALTARPESPRHGGLLKRIGDVVRDLLRRDDISDRIEETTGQRDVRLRTDVPLAVFMNYYR